MGVIVGTQLDAGSMGSHAGAWEPAKEARVKGNASERKRLRTSVWGAHKGYVFSGERERERERRG